MTKSELKNINDLFFRWWKDEIRTGEQLTNQLERLKKKNDNLKSIAYENIPQKGRRA